MSGERGGLGKFERLHRRAQIHAEPQALLRGLDFRYSILRTCLLGLGLFVYGLALLPGDPRRRLRLGALCVLAALSYASYYRFFIQVRPGGFAANDNLHYYLGSKYADELGYFGLYECGLFAAAERGMQRPRDLDRTRDLRTMELTSVATVRSSGSDCPDRFSAARWQSFGDDVEWFGRRIRPGPWKYLWGDHGYHPSPVWSTIGGALANRMPTDDRVSMYILARIDRFIVAATIALVAWGFGIEVACLVAILWGTGMLWRYAWLGDAMLRHLWWFAAFAGVVFLRRGKVFLSGAALSLTTLLRLFPAAFPLCLLIHFGRRALAARAIPIDLWRIIAGGAFASLLLVGLTVAGSDRGISVFAEFAEKIGIFSIRPSFTGMGLLTVGNWLFPESPGLVQLFHGTIGFAFAVLLWRALGLSEAWEAAALGFALIPVLTRPINYYWGFIILAVLLATQRPRIGVLVLITALALNLNGLVFYYSYEEFSYGSLIGCLGCFAIVLDYCIERGALSFGWNPLRASDSRREVDR